MNYLDFSFAHEASTFKFKNSYNESLNFFQENSLNRIFHFYDSFFSFEEALSNPDELKEINEVANYLSKFERILVLGIGGSILNGKVFAHFANNHKISFIDNIDPFNFDLMLKEINLIRTGIIIISKSGNTPEVVCQTLSLIGHIQTYYNFSFNENIVLITTQKHNFLTQFSGYIEPQYTLKYKKIGGRFSIFSSVGLILAKLSQLSPEKIIEGANKVIEHFLHEDVGSNIVIKAACESYTFYKERFFTHVLMIYKENYKIFGEWYRQIYSESLGKFGKGILPINARGATDQHSQLQLYLAGQHDKYFTFFSYDSRKQGAKMSLPFKCSENDYLDNMTMGDLFYYEKEATIQSLKNAGLPVRQLILNRCDEIELGSILMHYMIETILIGFQMEINPFDQPTVEESKVLVKNYLEQIKISNYVEV